MLSDSLVIDLLILLGAPFVVFHVWAWALGSPRAVHRKALKAWARYRHRNLPPGALRGAGWILFPKRTP